MARGSFSPLERLCDLRKRLLASHALQKAQIVFRPRPPNRGLLASYCYLGHNRSSSYIHNSNGVVHDLRYFASTSPTAGDRDQFFRSTWTRCARSRRAANAPFTGPAFEILASKWVGKRASWRHRISRKNDTAGSEFLCGNNDIHCRAGGVLRRRSCNLRVGTAGDQTRVA